MAIRQGNSMASRAVMDGQQQALPTKQDLGRSLGDFEKLNAQLETNECGSLIVYSCVQT